MQFDKLDETNKQTFKKIQFLKLTPGIHQIRILDTDGHLVYSHYISNKYSVKCLGEACPVCDNNKRIMLDNPENYRNVSGWVDQSRQWLLNVLDRSQVKICPNCKKENKRYGKQFLPTCQECNTLLVDVPVTNLNEVKLMSVGKKVAQAISALESAIIDTSGEDIPATKYDLILSVEGVGTKREVTVLKSSNTDVVEVDPALLYDRSKATLELSADEIRNVLRGVSLKDIYSARNVTKQSVNPSQVATVKSDLSKLFSEE